MMYCTTYFNLSEWGSYTYRCVLKAFILQVEEDPDVLTGLVLKDLNKNITILFKFARHSYVVGDDNSLQFSSSAGKDCGNYRCTLWPPLGHYIQEKDYEYYSSGEYSVGVKALMQNVIWINILYRSQKHLIHFYAISSDFLH